MSRIRKVCLARFRVALRRLGARQTEKGLALLLNRAAARSATANAALQDALAQLDAQLQRQWARFSVRRTGKDRTATGNAIPRFVCDAGLGGLARWLRAAGYEAAWSPEIGDDALLRAVREQRAILLTTDSLLLERRVIRDGVIPTVWLPPLGRAPEQLARVFRELRLKPLSPRCMACGGELRQVDKTAVAARIPPRTARWLDDYFVCACCDQLFWHGTHWQRIAARLRELDSSQNW